MAFQLYRYTLPLLLASPLFTSAISLDIDDSCEHLCLLCITSPLTNCEASIKNAARTISKNLLSYYTGDKPGQPVGLFPKPHLWWEAGAIWSSLIDYWAYTEDDQYNDLIQQALIFQLGPNDNYMPPNQTKFIGHDDQGFWAL